MWRVANFSMITVVPLRVSKPVLPPVTGMVLATAPLIPTVIWCAARSAFITTDWPTVKPPLTDTWP